MQRAQIVLDESTASRLRGVAEQSHLSMSDIVRRALTLYFDRQEPDTSWIGSLVPPPGVSHDLRDIRASVEKARKRRKR